MKVNRLVKEHICMTHDPWPWTMMWGLTTGVGGWGGLGRGGQREKIGTIVIA